MTKISRNFLIKAVFIGVFISLLVPNITSASGNAQTYSVETQQVQNKSPKIGSVSLKIEPGLSIPLTPPQSQLFKLGISEDIKVLWLLTPYLDLGPSISFTTLPTKIDLKDSGTAWSLGGSLRLKTPKSYDVFYSLYPWVAADLLYVRTDSLNRTGLAASIGISIPTNEEKSILIGPFVKYMQIIQLEKKGYDTRDARILSIGVSLEIGPGSKKQEKITINKTTVEKTDCEDKADPDVWILPKQEKLFTTPSEVTITKKIYFDYDKSIILGSSIPALNEVIRILVVNKNIKVRIEGHASSEGKIKHNQILSENRAKSVLDYLVASGIDKNRLTSVGLGSSIPAATNNTLVGKEQNRRVEFIVDFIVTKNTK